jgi:hypothetical protein
MKPAGSALFGAASYASNVAASEITGQSEHFSWAGLAASAAASGLTSELGLKSEALQKIGLGSNSPLGDVEGGLLSGGIDRETSLLLGDNHVSSWASVGEDAFGNALGNWAGQKLGGEIDQMDATWRKEKARNDGVVLSPIEIKPTNIQVANYTPSLDSTFTVADVTSPTTLSNESQQNGEAVGSNDEYNDPTASSVQTVADSTLDRNADGTPRVVTLGGVTVGPSMPNYTIALPSGNTYTIPRSLMLESYLDSYGLGQDQTPDKSMSVNAYQAAISNLPAIYSDLMASSKLSFQDKYDASVAIPGEIVSALSLQQGYPFTLDGYEALYAQNKALQGTSNLFDPKSSVVYVDGWRAAGAAMSAFSPSAAGAVSFNPISVNGPAVGISGTLSNSFFEDNNYEPVGTIFVVNNNKFEAFAEAYASVMQGGSGGFTGDGLNTDYDNYKFEIPTHAVSDGMFEVTSNALDAANFMTDVHSAYNNFESYGQVNIYMKDNQMYFNVVNHNYKYQTNTFSTTMLPTNSDTYQNVLQGIHHDH